MGLYELSPLKINGAALYKKKRTAGAGYDYLYRTSKGAEWRVTGDAGDIAKDLGDIKSPHTNLLPCGAASWRCWVEESSWNNGKLVDHSRWSDEAGVECREVSDNLQVVPRGGRQGRRTNNDNAAAALAGDAAEEDEAALAGDAADEFKVLLFVLALATLLLSVSWATAAEWVSSDW